MSRPRRYRRILSGLNAVLVLSALGLGARYLLVLRPALADGARRLPVADGVRRASAPAWVATMPVSRPQLDGVFFRPAFLARTPHHWPFGGLPMGPEATSEPPPAPEARRGLRDLGRVALVVGEPGNFVLSFAFAAGDTLAFRVGEIVRASHAERARFRLAAVTHDRAFRYRIEYDVLEDEGARRASFVFDAEADIDGLPGVAPVDSAPRRTGAPSSRPVDLPLETGARPRPRIRVVTPTRRDVSFGPRTWELLRRDGRRLLAETVGTTPVADPVSGAPYGLRLSFHRPELADAFAVRRGDILVSVDGRPVHTRADLIALADALSGASFVTVVLDRSGRQITYRVDPRDPRVIRDARSLRPR